MERKFASAVILPLAGFFAVLALAYASRVLTDSIQALNARLFSTGLIYTNLWTSALAVILVMGALLGLFWIILTRSPRWIGWFYLIAGIFLLIYPIAFFAVLQQVHTLPFMPLLSPLFQYLVPGSLLYAAAGGVGMLGLFKLVLRRPGGTVASPTPMGSDAING